MRMTYCIRHTSHEGTMRTLNISGGHVTPRDALAKFRGFLGADELFMKPGDEGEYYVYNDRETMERDDDDSAAVGVIEPEPPTPTTLTVLMADMSWCYDEAADKSDTRGTPPRSYGDYDMENYFDLGVDAEFPSREEAIRAALAAYVGPDDYGVGIDLSDLRVELPERA
jgi:hypothetical protein